MFSMRSRKSLVASSVLLICGLLVFGCREEEQGRVLWHEKGVYLGPPDTTISEETQVDLRHRAARQKY